MDGEWIVGGGCRPATRRTRRIRKDVHLRRHMHGKSTPLIRRSKERTHEASSTLPSTTARPQRARSPTFLPSHRHPITTPQTRNALSSVSSTTLLSDVRYVLSTTRDCCSPAFHPSRQRVQAAEMVVHDVPKTKRPHHRPEVGEARRCSLVFDTSRRRVGAMGEGWTRGKPVVLQQTTTSTPRRWRVVAARWDVARPRSIAPASERPRRERQGRTRITANDNVGEAAARQLSIRPVETRARERGRRRDRVRKGIVESRRPKTTGLRGAGECCSPAFDASRRRVKGRTKGEVGQGSPHRTTKSTRPSHQCWGSAARRCSPALDTSRQNTGTSCGGAGKASSVNSDVDDASPQA